MVKADSKAKGTLTLHLLPNINQLYAQLRGAKVFTTLNLRSGYYHIELGKDSQAKTAFVTPFGKYEFNMVPFGLAQAPASFQALISKVLIGLHKFAVTYLDDSIIFSKDEEHLEHLRIIFQRLKEAGLKLKRSKYDFMKTQIQYLEHLISSKGIEPLPEKLRSIKNMPAPRSPKEVKQFLGLAEYYHKFIPRFSDLSRPLTRLTRKDVLFEWTKECQSCFKLLKQKLCTYPILQYLDLNKSYVLFTDASKYGWAGVLTQPYEEIDESDQSTANIHSSRWKTVYHPVSYISELFRGSQLNWAALMKEAYAISMDLIGEFYSLSQQGHRYALTVICMHTSYIFCIPLKSKTAQEVVQAYLHHVYSKFGGSEKILSDNGTEFKNKLFEEVASQLGVEYKVYTPPYRPQCNGKIEGFHKYLKSCIAKHIINNMEWDEFTDLATAAYNFMPNVSSKESPFFLMFGRDPYMPLNKLLSQATRYLGTDEGIPDLEALQNLLQMTTTQIEYAATKRNQSFKPVKPHDFKVGDLVLVRNHMSKAFQEKYQDSYRVVRLLGKNQLKVKDQNNHVRQVHITDIKKTTMPEVLVKSIPDYKQFG